MKSPFRTLRFFFIFTIVLLLLGSALAFAQGPDNPGQPPASAVELDAPLLDLLVEPTDAGFVVSWRTAEPQTGWVEYSASWDQMASIAYDERGAETIDTQHRVVIEGLNPGAVVYYNIVSGDQRFDNGGSAFKRAIGDEQFAVEVPQESVDMTESPDMQAEVVGPMRPIDEGVNKIDEVPGDTAHPLVPNAPSSITCDPEVFYGVQHCVDSGAHMIIVNLRDSHVRVQTVLSNGPNGECNSVNHVGKDGTSNCPNPYPIEHLSSMLARYQARGGVAIIDSDYSAMPQGDHGAEGLTVRNGVRLDGTAHGDYDGNSTRRSSLAFSANKEARIGKPASESGIDPRGAYYNTTGGGPTIVRDGSALGNSACAADRLDSGVCTRFAQSAAGLTGDSRLILLTATKDAAGMASYLVNSFHVHSAIKFDGGGSARMAWVDASGQVRQWGATSEDRRLANGLLILSERRQTTDPDDNRTLTSGQALNGTINPANDQDTYYVDATQGQRATVRMNRTDSGSLDSYLYLYAPNGSWVAENDDGGGSLNSLINQVTLPQTGRYRILAKSYNSASTGAYSLSLSLEGGSGGGGSLVSNIRTSSGRSYGMTTCSIGTRYYIDRDYSITGFSHSDYNGLPCMKTANADKANTSGNLIEFDLNRPARIYIYWDRRAGSGRRPNWMKSLFAGNGKRVNVSDGDMGYFEVYSCDSTPGHIVLGGPRSDGGNGNGSMFVVGFREISSGERRCSR